MFVPIRISIKGLLDKKTLEHSHLNKEAFKLEPFNLRTCYCGVFAYVSVCVYDSQEEPMLEQQANQRESLIKRSNARQFYGLMGKRSGSVNVPTDYKNTVSLTVT